MKTVFMHYKQQTFVRVDFGPTSIFITSKSNKAKKWAERTLIRESAKIDLPLRKRRGRYSTRDVSIYIEKYEMLYKRLCTC